MKHTTCLIALCCLSASLLAQHKGDQLFDPGYVHEIRFETEQPGFYVLLTNAWLTAGNGPIPYNMGNVRIDGNLVDSVGVRLKGGLSIFDNKKPLKIDFNHYVSGKQYDGVKKLNLQNASYDAAVQRDLLGYHIFREAGIKASRAAYTKVFMNDVYVGVYIMVEQVDEDFLQNMFASDGGILYKNKNLGVEVDSGEPTLAYYNEMVSIATNLSGQAFVNAIEKVLDTDACLRFFLVENFIEAKDNPIDVNSNFYLYRQPETGLLYWIPWDLNYAFFGGTSYPLVHTLTGNAVYKKMLQTPVYRQRYLELACEMLEYALTEDKLHQFIEQNAQLIRTDLMTDTYFPYTIDRFDLEINTIKTLISDRRQDFLNGLNTEPFTCPAFENPAPNRRVSINEFVASNDSTGGIADPSGGYADWIELYNNTADTISLRGFYLSHDADFKKHWPFPPTASIAPNEYLIVWADRDIAEPGLHCDFKLDKSGGQIYLIYEDFSITDSVAYGPQLSNIASARIPNGTGPFVQQAPTFGAHNGVSATASPEGFVDFVLYPNPVAGQLHLGWRSAETGTATVQLLNLLGKVVFQQETNSSATTLDLQSLPAGVYFVVLAQGNRRMIRQVVVTKG